LSEETNRSVGLIVFTQLPNDEELSAILQIRGEFNHEKMRPESWPGLCQLTVHGRCEPGENARTALLREIKEELGLDGSMVCSIGSFSALAETEGSSNEVSNFAVNIAPNWFLKSFRLSLSSGGIRLVKKKQLNDILPAQKHDRDGVPRHKTVMFKDDIEALKKAFEMFEN